MTHIDGNNNREFLRPVASDNSDLDDMESQMRTENNESVIDDPVPLDELGSSRPFRRQGGHGGRMGRGRGGRASRIF